MERLYTPNQLILYNTRVDFTTFIIFFNLAVINALSIYTDFFLEEIDQRNGSRKKAPLSVLTVSQLVLLYLPMLVSMTYAARKAYSFCKKRAGRRSRDYEMLEEVNE